MKNKAPSALNGKRIVLGVCSSIAVYKAADLTSRLVKEGAEVTAVLTEHAAKLISPRIFQTLSRRKAYVSMWDDVDDWKPEHISLSDWADLLIVAPATANTIGNFARALAPDMLSTLYLAARCPVLVAPAMNSNMYEHPAVVENLKILKDRGVFFADPADGMLACGKEGKGKLADVETIIALAAKILG